MEPLRAEDPRQIGVYKLASRLGAGGMGSVFLGFSPAGRRVAVKVVHPGLAADRDFRKRFAREVDAAREVSGAYTAPVVDAGDGDPLWLATALVKGPSLADAVGSHGPLDEVSLWRLAAGLAEALGAVHKCRLVHRDLKPSNVMLADDGPRVIDFGIARALDLDGTKLTDTGALIGTPAYMSPEQVSGATVGPGSDVFSFGSVLTFAGTGRPPFGEGANAELLYRIAYGEPALDGLPGPVADLVRRCLAKSADDRASLTEVMEAVTANVTAGSTAGPFWPDALASVIDSHRALLLADPGAPSPGAPAGVAHPDTETSPGSPADSRPPLVPQPPRRTRRRLSRRRAAAITAIAAAVIAGVVTVVLLPGSPPAKVASASAAPPVPAISRTEAQRVLTTYARAYNRATMLRSDSVLATIETGPSYHMDAGHNRWSRVSDPGRKSWATISLAGEALYIPRMPAGAFPRWFAARITQTLQTTASGPIYAVFVQASKGAGWKAAYQVPVLASPPPTIALDDSGYAEQVAPADTRLSAPPRALAANTASALDDNGAQVNDPWEATLADRQDQKFWHDHLFTSSLAIDSDTHFPLPDRVFGLKTADGGALVFYGVGAQLNLAEPDGTPFQLQIPGYYTYATSQTSAEIGYLEQYATNDPPHGTPQVIGGSSNIISRS